MVYLDPQKYNTIAQAQQTVHILNSKSLCPFQECFSYKEKISLNILEFKNVMNSYSVVKFIIPKQIKEDLRRYLETVNINYKTLLI